MADSFSPGLTILDGFQAKEFALHVRALESFFSDDIIARQASSVILGVFLSLGEFNLT